jgi:hypothetical protein
VGSSVHYIYIFHSFSLRMSEVCPKLCFWLGLFLSLSIVPNVYCHTDNPIAARTAARWPGPAEGFLTCTIRHSTAWLQESSPFLCTFSILANSTTALRVPELG